MSSGTRAPRSVMSRLLPRKASDWVRQAVEQVTYPPDFRAADIALCEAVAEFTMTSPERILALHDAVRYLVQNRIEGDIVECGVWRGGSMMVVAKTLLALGDARDLYLCDTFEGMSPPTEHDRAFDSRTAEEMLEKTSREAGRSAWCIAGEDDVRQNVFSTGYPSRRVHFVRGKVEDTLPEAAPERIALLRLDTDWYESTKHELEVLYPRLVEGGVLILDDYGYWQGARKAVDEYFAGSEFGTSRPLLHRIDLTGRMVVKRSHEAPIGF
jgi:O-methyltransferase